MLQTKWASLPRAPSTRCRNLTGIRWRGRSRSEGDTDIPPVPGWTSPSLSGWMSTWMRAPSVVALAPMLGMPLLASITRYTLGIWLPANHAQVTRPVAQSHDPNALIFPAVIIPGQCRVGIRQSSTASLNPRNSSTPRICFTSANDTMPSVWSTRPVSFRVLTRRCTAWAVTSRLSMGQTAIL